MSIHLKDESDLVDKLIAAMQLTSAQAVLFSHVVAERLGMNPTDLECLGYISGDQALTAGDLAELTGLTTGAITGVIDRLEKSGYVRRESDPSDRRKVIITPIPERQHELQQPFVAIEQAARELFETYSKEELSLINNFLNAANRVALEQIRRLQGQKAKANSKPARPAAGTDFSAPLGAISKGRLNLVKGAAHLTLGAQLAADLLYQGHFVHPLPTVREQGGKITFRYNQPAIMLWLDWRDRPCTININPLIPWQLEMHGGASKVLLDLRRINLTEFELSGGASEIALKLGEPTGTVPIQISGGASKASIQYPPGVEVRVNIAPAAINVVLEDRRIDKATSATRWESPDYKKATNRYDIEIRGGAKDTTIRPAQQ